MVLNAVNNNDEEQDVAPAPEIQEGVGHAPQLQEAAQAPQLQGAGHAQQFQGAGHALHLQGVGHALQHQGAGYAPVAPDVVPAHVPVAEDEVSRVWGDLTETAEDRARNQVTLANMDGTVRHNRQNRHKNTLLLGKKEKRN